MTTFSQGPDRLTLDAVSTYGRRQGYAIRVNQFHDMPELWKKSYQRRMYRMTGISDVLSLGRAEAVARAEVAYCCGAELDLVAFGLLHEVAHCEQVHDVRFEGLGYNDATDALKWEIEVDAWHRALRIAGEQGWEVTSDMVEFAQAALASYATDGAWEELSIFVP